MHKKTFDILNFRDISRYLAGGDLNITRVNIPKKYSKEMNVLIDKTSEALDEIDEIKKGKNKSSPSQSN